jgi:hypothetical protein
MDPPSGNNHSVTLAQINLGDLVDHVAKPCMTLYLDDDIGGDKPSIP